ncbi:molecular chaperone [Chromatiales bacterium (ex Bugula neritina AB1)]|nr:molecular chaperone [Chromatiales bacterium (ex Bugula neritina AB1)]
MPPDNTPAIGFDYGTSNCAMSVRDSNGLRLIPLQGSNSPFIPSALYAIEREYISDNVVRAITDKPTQTALAEQRSTLLNVARLKHREAGTSPEETVIYLGEQAIDLYLQQPDEGYFIKSPKSFLGATGLADEAIAFFEDVVTWMMQQLVSRATSQLQQQPRQTVIGRPVNFQGANVERSNQQAIGILTTAAQRAGFTDIEFMIEPVAAGMAFEQTLQQNQCVLVVDIGGGTSDVALLQMGPDFRNNFNRDDDILGHSGERIGGNDLDIQLSFRHLMPIFGLGTQLKNGLPMPAHPFWLAVSVNDVNLQTEFYKPATLRELKQLHIDSKDKQRFSRLLSLRKNQQNYQLVRSAELAKIELSSKANSEINLEFVEPELATPVSQVSLEETTANIVTGMMALITEVTTQASVPPDCVFITGGSAKSPMIRKAIEHQLGRLPIFDGDDFGSVAAGLGQWASVIYR